FLASTVSKDINEDAVTARSEARGTVLSAGPGAGAGCGGSRGADERPGRAGASGAAPAAGGGGRERGAGVRVRSGGVGAGEAADGVASPEAAARGRSGGEREGGAVGVLSRAARRAGSSAPSHCGRARPSGRESWVRW